MPLALDDGYSLGVDPQINYQDPGPIATGQAPQGSPLSGPLGMSNTESFTMPGGGAPPSAAQRLRDLISQPLPQAQVAPLPLENILGWTPRYQQMKRAQLNAAEGSVLQERRVMLAEAKAFADLDEKQYDMSMKQVAAMAQYINDNPMASPEQRRRFGQQLNATGARAGLPDLSPLMGTMAESPEVSRNVGDALPYAAGNPEAFGQVVAGLTTMSKHGATPEQKQTAIDDFVGPAVWADVFRNVRDIARAGEQSGKKKDGLDILFDLKNRGPEGEIMYRAVLGGGKGNLAKTPHITALLEQAGLTDPEAIAKAHSAELQAAATKRGAGATLETPVAQKLAGWGYQQPIDPSNPEHARAIRMAEDVVKADVIRQGSALTGAQEQAKVNVELSPSTMALAAKKAGMISEQQADAVARVKQRYAGTDPLSPSDVKGIRDEYMRASQDFIKRRDSVIAWEPTQGTVTTDAKGRRVRQVVDTGASDITRLYTYIKLLDPNAVREGELGLVRSTVPFLQDKVRQINNLISNKGQVIPPQVRNELDQQIRSIYAGHVQSQLRTETDFKKMAANHGVSPDSIALPSVVGPHRGFSDTDTGAEPQRRTIERDPQGELIIKGGWGGGVGRRK